MTTTLSFTTRLDRIHCHDEGDGPGNAEPYLWPVFWKVDGSSFAYESGAGLIGNPIVDVRNGHHGNLGTTDVDAGNDVGIPDGLGTWETQLKTIPINDSGIQALLGADDIPGMAGVVAVLMEADGWTDSLADTGYNALVDAVQLSVARIAADFQHALQAPTQAEIKAKIDTVKATAADSVHNQVKGSMDAFQLLWYGTFGDNDDQVGTEAFTVNTDQLRDSGWYVAFNRRWSGDESGDGDWEVFGWFEGAQIVTLPAGTTCNLDGLFRANEKVSGRQLHELEAGFNALRGFRDTDYRSYTGLEAWWHELGRATPELVRLSAERPAVRQALEELVLAAPRVLNDPAVPLERADVDNLRTVLEALADDSGDRSSAVARQALRVTGSLEGKPWAEAVEMASRFKPRGRTLRQQARRY
jgi:hypothetical protein